MTTRLYEYKWEEHPGLSQGAPHCRNKTCQKAHYKYGEPKRKMVALIVVPDRKKYFNWIWFCDHCKSIKLMPNNG